MKTLLHITFTSLLLVFLSHIVKADVKLPRIFSSNMVLQQGIEIPVWGWADKGEQIMVIFNKKTIRTKANTEGKWKVNLPVQEYGGPHTLTVKGKNTIVFDNVLIGDVWVCSGQSNMEWSVDRSKNAEEEIALANYPKIRLFTVPKTVAQFPKDDISSGEWVECSPETIGGFSAVGYFFGKKLQTELEVPIGLLHTSWGGTVAETWTSAETISDDPDFKEMLVKLQQMNLENYKEQKLEEVKKILGGEFPTEDKGMENGKPVWSALDFNDSNWKTIKTPTYWEAQGYMDIDGIGWYRKEIQLTEEQSQSNLTLHLGKVDDSDITFLNGIEIGKTENKYNEERIYTVDKKYIQPGKNMIVVRVDDTGGNGGIWGDPKDQFIAIGNEKMDISGDWKFKISKASVSAVNIGPNSYPTLLFNGMINPLLPYAIKGAIWYQGESNASRAKQYQRIFPDLIEDWRAQWNQGDFPFLFVSLANYMKPVETPAASEWAELREAQTKTLSLPNTGMAVTIDIGEANDIHPKNKQDVGKRLALNALKVAYGKEIVFSGPMFESVEFSKGKATIVFSETGSGLKVKDKYGYLKGFEIAGSDKKFHWAKAELATNNSVVVSAEEVENPVAVRYGWANNPDDLNLYNKEGLPANPFRTDDWPGITK
ncbi:sialate O-acetylesterase [Maribellus maritimus]|uniref:sialate O-acetylesterase n=1 Tax=Maribellus maritimus TaxID=2870838 RepID=UPI001EEC74D7|nr:sialate O-acetylesterase [Maribellus maritimus]MCG6187792.1 beta galactosidase jelly roll domain-containing protein [Maribellus maritimus]